MQNASVLAEQSGKAHVNVVDILRWPGVMETQEEDINSLQAELMAAFDPALVDFVAGRGREGVAIEQMIRDRLDQISTHVSTLRTHLPQALQWQRDKMLNRLQEVTAELDQNRLDQEMAFLAQKSDVAEELDRLDAHIKETRHSLKQGGAIGRRLDFMMQEFNREANTVSSKAISTEITNTAVELKV